MKLKVFLAAAALVVCSHTIWADDKPKKEPWAKETAAMEAMMKAGTPGDAHNRLWSMVGSWDTKVTMWMQPGAPPQVSSGTSENRWVLDGRWLEQRYSGNFMNMPFNGIGYTGYDNIKKQYMGTWMDNMSTSVMISNGTTSSAANTYEFTSTVDDPMTGKSAPMKEKVTVVDADHHMMEMWGPAPDGTMYKMMQIDYTRKK